MATPRTVWGIDIGHCALKALKLGSVEGQLQVEAFDVVEHPRILSQPDADRPQLIRNALEQFLARNSVANSTIVVAVPGQSSFTRFVKLPPVEPKQVPDIVRFEAEQQIPFPIEEVIWQWQTFQDPDSPDVEVGIFAMKRVDVAEMLDHFRDVELDVDVVQMAPLALYNFMVADDQTAEEGATLLADVGADKTDLVVSDGARIWTRTIQIGGNNFTEALVRAFKLSFPKAEKLKRTAASSKYARQIFQAMRPVFADLVQEIQRSVGYYTSLHRDARFKKMIGLGNGFRLPGLQKYLEQNINIPVTRVDTYNNLNPSPQVNAPQFTENVLSFAPAYGLAVQGLGEATVSTNLLPIEVMRRRAWAIKKPWWIAAAAMIVVALGCMVFGAYRDKLALAGGQEELQAAQRRVTRYEQLKDQFRTYSNEGQQEIDQVRQYMQMFGYRDFWPAMETTIIGSISEAVQHQQLLEEYAAVAGAGEDAETRRQEILRRIASIPRSRREMIFIENLRSTYYEDVSELSAEQLIEDRREQTLGDVGPARRQRRPGFWVEIDARTTLPRTEAGKRALNRMVTAWRDRSYARAEPFDVLTIRGFEWDITQSGIEGPRTGGTPAEEGLFDGMNGGAAETNTDLEGQDPLLTDETTANDQWFRVGWLVEVTGDGITVAEPREVEAQE